MGAEILAQAQERAKPEPKELSSDADRQMLRRQRDFQWSFMERIRDTGTLWWCIWNKRRLPEGPDEYRNGLLSGMDLNEWVHAHPEWFEVGEWDEQRYALPIRLTEAGLAALSNRELYDMEPVTGGLVEPGYIGIPAPPALQDAPAKGAGDGC